MKKTSTEFDRMKDALEKKGKASFGRAQAYAPGPNEGGAVSDPNGAPTEDTVPTILAAGEYVLPADTVEQVGVEQLEALKNATHAPVKASFGRADGGVIQAIRNRPRRIDVAEQAAVNNTPPPPAPPVKTIEQQTKEKVLQPAQDLITKVKKVFGMQAGGLITGRAKRINEAVDAAAAPAAPAAAPAAPAPRQMPANPLDAQIAAQQAAIRAQNAAEAAKPKGIFGRAKAALGMAQGGMVWGRPGAVDDPTKQGPSALYQSMTRSAFDPQASAAGQLQPHHADRLAGMAARDKAIKQQAAAAAGTQPVEPAAEVPAVAQPNTQQFGRQPAMPRQRETGWTYQNGRIAMVRGGRVGIDGVPILDDVAQKGPGYHPARGALDPKLPGEPVAGPQQPIDEQLKRANAARPQSEPNLNPNRPDGTRRADSVQGNKPAAPDKLGEKVAAERAKEAAERAKAAAKKAGTVVTEAAQKGFGRVTQAAKAVAGAGGAALRFATGPVVGGALAATHSPEAGAGSDIVPGNPRPGAFNVTPEAAAMGSVAQSKLMAELNNPRTHPERQAQIRELMIGKAPVAADASPRQKSDFGNPLPPAAAAPAAPTPGTTVPTPGTINTPALAGMGIAPEALERPAVPDAMRGQIVREARPDPGFQVNLGDYGGDGQAIFGQASKPGGRIDTFTGAGRGTNQATGYAPKGVDFGIKPGDVEKYKAGLNAYSQLGPRPDALRNPVAYSVYQRAASERSQADAVGQASMVRAQADFANAINTGNKDAAIAAAESAKAEIARVAENTKSLNDVAERFATQGYFGDTDPKVAAAAMQNIIALTPMKLKKDGTASSYADLNGKEKETYIGQILAATESHLGKEGLFSSIGSVAGQGSVARPLTTAQAWNQAAAGNLDAVTPWTPKQWSRGDGKAFKPGSTESLKSVMADLEEQRKKDKQ